MQKKLDLLLKKAYAPYSKVKVSAIVETNDGQEYHGINIENATFTPTICAERNAIFQAIIAGSKKGDFKALHLTASTTNVLNPCGVCQQVMAEFFKPETKIYLWKNNKSKVLTFKELMPFQVQKKDLK